MLSFCISKSTQMPFSAANTTRESRLERLASDYRLIIMSENVGVTKQTFCGQILDTGNNNNYMIALRRGEMKGLYTRNKPELCPQWLSGVGDVGCEEHASL